jgi:hypothetical protein
MGFLLGSHPSCDGIDLKGWVPSVFLRKHTDSSAASLLPDAPRRIDQLLLLLAFVGAFSCMHVYFGVQPHYSEGSFWLESRVEFSRDDFAKFLTSSMQAGMVIGALAVTYAAAMSFRSATKR